MPILWANALSLKVFYRNRSAIKKKRFVRQSQFPIQKMWYHGNRLGSGSKHCFVNYTSGYN